MDQSPRQRQIAFHTQEIAEGPGRGMPEVQLDIHRRQLAIHMDALGLAEVIPLPIKEEPEDLIA